MSSVRMCDQCGNIFSENSEGWTTFSGSRQRRREDGSRFTETITQDACVSCSNRFQEPPKALSPKSPEEAGLHLTDGRA